MKKLIATLCVCSILLFSCEKNENPDSRKEITSFVINGSLNGLSSDIIGAIEQQQLTITIKHNVSSAAVLVPTIAAHGTVYYNGALYTDGTRIDFSKKVTLRVVAADGSAISYTVEVVDPVNPGEGSNDNRMTAYSLILSRNGSSAVYNGDINHTAGTITFAPGTAWIENITSAKAEFTTEGVKVSVGTVEQVSKVSPNDFTRDVVYTVTAESGKKRTYTVSVACPQSTGLPVMRVVTDGGAAINSKTTYVPATVNLNNYDFAGYNITNARAGIRGRGNSTWGYAKKPYRIKFDSKTKVLGHQAAKSWVLLANWQDPTLILNTVAFELGRRLGIPFTNNAEHVELFLNGDYKGSYVLSEQIQVNPGRVDIDPVNDVLLEIDTNYDDPFYFSSGRLGMRVNIKSPELENMNSTERNAKVASITADFNQMEYEIMRSGFPTTTNWRDYTDVPSLIDFLLLNELVHNIELGHPKSTFLWKTVGGKWTWGPGWDFDWGYGYNGGQSYWSNAENQIYRQGGRTDHLGYRFFCQLFEEPQFRAEYKKRWNEIKPLISDIDQYVKTMGEMLDRSASQNKERWSSQYTRGYQGQITEMQSWLTKRIAYLNTTINKY